MSASAPPAQRHRGVVLVTADAKQRALIGVDMGYFSDAVAFLGADLDANPLTKGVVSSEHACADTKRRWMRRSAGVRKR